MKTTIALIASIATASAFSPAAVSCGTKTSSSSALAATRRESMEKIGIAAFGGMFLASVQPAQAADPTKAEEAEFNELINLLKARSDENKEANANYAMRAGKLSDADFKDAQMRRPKLVIVSTSKGNKIFTKEEFKTLDCDGKIDTVYGTRMKQGGGEMKDYNDITYVLKE